jgi:site-specific recombinase XerD
VLLRHLDLPTTQSYTQAKGERMASVVATW